MTDNNIEKSKQELIAEIDKRIEDKIIEQTNADLLKKLINNADTLTEAVAIATLGTTYKRTGFHFDKRLEKMSDTIKYFKKNEELSFKTSDNAITHKLIIGDNYDALLNLLVEYRGRIDVIYIDPPYGKDSMGEFARTNYENAITRDNLLSMLYPRLVLARQLLSDNGVIFCSIDDKNQAYVKCLFDEVFGESCSVAQLVWEKKKKGSFLSNQITNIKEYTIAYCNNPIYFNGLIGEINAETETYPCVNAVNAREIRRIPAGIKSNYAKQNYMLSSGTIISDTTMTLILHSDLVIENGRLAKELVIEGNWRYSQESMSEYATKNELYITRDLYLRRIVSDPRRKTLKDILPREGDNPQMRYDSPVNLHNLFESGWGSNEDADEELRIIFGTQKLLEYPKPVKLLLKLIASYRNKEIIVLDFFAGSGTTGQAVLELNKQDGGQRQFILATLDEITDTTPNGIIKDVTSKRLKRVMTGECYDGTSDFKWLEKNKPLGDNLDVYDISTVANFEATKGKTPFDVIDETLYGQEKLNVNDKIKWVCENFDGTQKRIGGER